MNEETNKNNENKNIKIIVIFIAILVIFLCVYIACVYLLKDSEVNEVNNQNTTQENEFNEKTEEESYMEDEITYKIVKYDYKLTSKDKYYKSTTNYDGLFTLYEGKKYDHIYYDDDNEYKEFIGLYEGKAVISKKNERIESNINNIKSMHFMGLCGDDYHGELAMLTSNGDIYITNICDYGSGADVQFDNKTFDKASKIESNNKYKDIAEVLIDYNYYENEYSGDTWHYQFVGITVDDKMDLIDEFINGELWDK